MRFKQFINEEDSDKLIWDAFNRIESLVGYSCTLRYVAELDVARLEIGHNYVREYKKAIFDEVKPEGQKDMGKVMKLCQEKLKGKTDMKEVSALVRSKLV